jgi:DNA-binding NtrC family response regulator
LLVDLKLAATRLDEPVDEAVDAPETDGVVTQAERQRLAATLVPTAQRTAVMYIESNIQMQDLIRDALKKAGYRVLVFGDPERAMARFQDDAEVAGCAIFSTGELGRAALDAFNQFAHDDATKNLPALLLLGAGHAGLAKKAEVASHRAVLKMPIKLKKLREKLEELAPPTAAAIELPGINAGPNTA